MMFIPLFVLAQQCGLKTCNTGEICSIAIQTKKKCPTGQPDCNNIYRCIGPSITQCSQCNIVVQKVIAQKNSIISCTAEQLALYMRSMCRTEPVSTKSVCSIIVTQYQQEIVKQVMAGTTSVCPSLFVCRGSIYPDKSKTPVPR